MNDDTVHSEKPNIPHQRQDCAQYDDDFALTEYIWRNYPELITGFEHRVGEYGGVTDGEATKIKGDAFARYLIRRFGKFNESDVARGKRELADGLWSFRRKVRNRILKDHLDTVFINRCPSCQQILTSPRTRQCLLCQLSWHDTSPDPRPM